MGIPGGIVLTVLRSHTGGCSVRSAKDNRTSTNDDNSSQDTTDGNSTGDGTTFSLPGYNDANGNAIVHSFKGWMKEFGITEIDCDPSSSDSTWKSHWDDNIENLKGELTQVQTASQKDMLEYKQVNGYIGTSVSESSYTMRDYQQAAKGIFQ